MAQTKVLEAQFKFDVLCGPKRPLRKVGVNWHFQATMGCLLLYACDSFQVLIFAEKKQDVDAIHEYLLLKGVEAVSIHGGKGNSSFLAV